MMLLQNPSDGLQRVLLALQEVSTRVCGLTRRQPVSNDPEHSLVARCDHDGLGSLANL